MQLNDSEVKELRLIYSGMAMQAVIQSPLLKIVLDNRKEDESLGEGVANEAVSFADQLIERLKISDGDPIQKEGEVVAREGEQTTGLSEEGPDRILGIVEKPTHSPNHPRAT